MMNNGRPLSKKQTVRLLVALTILAWATQTLLHQWGYGAELPADQRQSSATEEKFVPGDAYSGTIATLELRSEATIVGAEVKLRQICRWSDRDQKLFDPIGDLVLARLAPRTPFKSLSLQEIRGLLRDAGVNTAAINFAGAVSCTVSRSDVEYDEHGALQQWIDARQPTTQPEVPLVAGPAAVPSTGPSEPLAMGSLRGKLIADLAQRLNLPGESLQVDFKPQDEQVLNTSEPLFRFNIEPVRARSLGSVAWNVTLVGDLPQGNKKIQITANARAWRNEMVVARPLATRQIIRAEDFVERRTLVDQLSDDPLLSADQIVGQQASRELKPGSVLTARMIDPVQLVKSGQLITVTLDQGTVRIKIVVRAMESGSYGQTIRVKNETTREVFQVVLTGPRTATMNLSSMASIGGN
jgi:flagella basal body P-ring formation protein FlgA